MAHCFVKLCLFFSLFWQSLANEALLKKIVEETGATDSDSIYKVARTWLEGAKTKSNGIEALHYLADTQSHVLSSVKLGNHYATEGHPNMALKYFIAAGENGPHHASLYNAGRILAELGDWVGCLAYLRASATFHTLYPPEYVNADTATVATEAYDIVSKRLSREELPIVQAADVFVFGSLQDLPEEALSLWGGAVMKLIEFNQKFDDTNGQMQDEAAMKEVTQSLRRLWESSGSILSHLQTYIVLDNINKMLGPLSSLDDSYVPMAAGYAEALATHSIYCLEHFAVAEDDSACFNGAAASAMAYYRRTGDGPSAKRVLEAAQSHPQAATHWKYMEQTPRVFHSDLASKPWWDTKDFSAVLALEEAFRKNSKKLLKEIEAVKNLQEGRIRGVAEVEVGTDGNVKSDDNQKGGLQRIFTPYTGVRTENAETRETGAGGWAEFGPLFDGNSWNKENCNVVPTICEVLKNDASLCSSRAPKKSEANVWQLCGADTVVTILRLRPGTTILPHCGTTNSRLIMHFALEGAEGVEFTVGGRTVKNYGDGDGHAIVFDDSYEHSVYHGGDQDRFVVRAVLAHPELL
jgi:hypothetical protein